ncbi:hypothetical protein FA13DRAFT_1726248 [Coprinellus micaceus]|uniref:Uncharacterized protein n=1 Tax=Coprinellus micaceus TaxID=71717 RepID=A0A4Y7TSH9_COPMI|nr:hypothetical protein FA13DRAFT_1726248 [Coprinellus micaceus]
MACTSGLVAVSLCRCVLWSLCRLSMYYSFCFLLSVCHKFCFRDLGSATYRLL